MTTPPLKSQSTGSIPYIPAQAPFSPEQRAWLNGYLAGIFSRTIQDGPQVQQPASEPTPGATIHILYGSQSGTAEGIAKDLAKQAKVKGFESVLLELNDHQKMDRAQVQTALIVTSTWGDGEPPDNAVKFWKDIQSSDGSDWKNVSYSVLALGDSNYAEFCGAGKCFDERLHELGAKRLHERVDCDVDEETAAQEWTRRIWEILEAIPSAAHSNTDDQTAASATVRTASSTSNQPKDKTKYHRKHPFQARLILQKKLNLPGSAKDTRHVEISLDGSGLRYQAGDALGIYPSNDPDLVEALLKHCQLSHGAEVQSKDGKRKPIKEALTSDCQITKISQRLVTELESLKGFPPLSAAFKLREGMDLLDVIPLGAELDEQAFVDLLPRLQPRLYSIASSPLVHPDAVHLTVGVVRYEMNERMRHGICSTFLADRLSPSDKMPVFIHPSAFKLPEQTDQSIIMVGPGTGIAPFRGFLQERKINGGSGKNWLFFGDQKASTDFLYQEELKAFQSEGVLHRFHTAFSRDQVQKVYVQDRMQEQASELWKWIEEGAAFYVCGDARRMAKDVDQTLFEIIMKEGGMSRDQASAYVDQMKKEKRYQRDVY